MVQTILESRHRAGAHYNVMNLNAILDTARQIATILDVVLIVVSAIALMISGIGIMNIMLVTVTERTREIGLRMAVGAARRDILEQFLAEAVLISMAGGVAGIADRRRDSVECAVVHRRVRDSDFAAVDRGGVHGVAGGGADFRDSAGESGVEVESYGSAAVRVAQLSRLQAKSRHQN